jgi:hypothetical protein
MDRHEPVIAGKRADHADADEQHGKDHRRHGPVQGASASCCRLPGLLFDCSFVPTRARLERLTTRKLAGSAFGRSVT